MKSGKNQTDASLQRAGRGHGRLFFLPSASPRHYQDRDGAAHAQLDSLRQLIEVNVNAHGHALGEPIEAGV